MLWRGAYPLFADEPYTVANSSFAFSYMVASGSGGWEMETPVGICLPRSAEMVVSFLAVMKSGGAYIPMDPSHPADRIAYMMEVAGATRIITTRAVRDTKILEVLEHRAGKSWETKHRNRKLCSPFMTGLKMGLSWVADKTNAPQVITIDLDDQDAWGALLATPNATQNLQVRCSSSMYRFLPPGRMSTEGQQSYLSRREYDPTTC
jgi:non-ribosomal peptide synthetase component F